MKYIIKKFNSNAIKIMKLMTKEDFITFNLVDLLFCLYHGAGSLYHGEIPPVEFVKTEFEDAQKLSGPGAWEYELAKIVENQDREKLTQIVKLIVQQL